MSKKKCADRQVTDGAKDFSTGCGKLIASAVMLLFNLAPLWLLYYLIKTKLVEYGAGPDLYTDVNSAILALGILILWSIMDLKVEHNFLASKVEKILEE